jgi:hypothetical protein
MPQVGTARLRYRVEVDVDDVVEHAHGGIHGLRQTSLIQSLHRHMRRKIDRAEVAHCHLAI